MQNNQMNPLEQGAPWLANYGDVPFHLEYPNVSIADAVLKTALQVDVGAASYWSEIMQTTTSDHLLESGVISDPLVYLENVPDYQVRGKHDLLHALRVQRQTQKEEAKNAQPDEP